LEQKQNSVYIDGCFDLVHCGHFNAIRQASLLAPRLVVGVNSDEDIFITKGPSILNINERCAIIESCKWVTEVQRDTPYSVSEEVLDLYNCQSYAHGDDPCITSDGIDICEKLREVGRFRMIKRTTGVSTTDITGRLLRLVCRDMAEVPKGIKEPPKQKFLQTAQRIRNFSLNIKGESSIREPTASDTIVYYQASCDLYHPGVIERLRRAKEQGSYLYGGLWSDEMTRYYRGDQFPLMCLQERLLMVMACKYVDDIVIEAPFIITEDLIKSLNISKVVNVCSNDDTVLPEHEKVD